MCGIAGFVATQPGDQYAHWANHATRALSHRGPDDHAAFAWSPSGGSSTIGPDAHVGLIHRRLSIIDLSAGGRQPRATPDGRYVLIFNGEIYNYRELRAELVATTGYVFQSQSDSEVLLAAWQAWNSRCIPKLTGMYAFAVLDTRANTLTLVRDNVGIKPLFTVCNRHGFAFASEPTVLLDWPDVQRRMNPQAVVDYLRFGFTDHLPETMFAEIGHVPAGSVLEVPIGDPGHFHVTRQWIPEPQPKVDLPFDEAAKTLRDKLTESVDLHLRSDVPVANCLSGGVDSSTLVALMRYVGGSSAEIHTFSHVARGTPHDEERFVDVINAQFSTVPHKVESTPEDLLDRLPTLIRTQQVPFSTTSIFAQYRVFEALHAEGLKVTLDGQGADELFGGYGFHIGARVGSLLKQRKIGAATKLATAAAGMHGLSSKTHWSNALDYLLPPNVQRLARKSAGRTLSPLWLDSGWCDSRGVSPDPYRTAESRDLVTEALCRSLAGPGLPHLLRYEDHNSMAFSVEARVPYLSQPLMSYALSLPESYLVSNQGETKHVLRRAMRGIVPDAILNRKDKVAFQTPESQWARAIAPWIEQRLESETARSLKVIDIEQALALWRQMQRGETPYNSVVWRWANLIEWARVFEVVP
ncbi:MAG: asparagine synthase (glutamine-hydrolyzing) [Armatimonadetes bacterium]|nr:asparagine synthase (glutamine-hydrolyzing) [Armatimonadota bacterium]